MALTYREAVIEAVRGAIEQGHGLSVFSSFQAGKRGLLFILQLINNFYPFTQQRQLII